MANLETLQKTLDLKSKEVYSYEKSVQIANDLFKSGRATYLEVLNAQRTAIEAKIDLINTKKSQYKSSINLYKALGGGWQ
jgi:outer membrane protein TolC